MRDIEGSAGEAGLGGCALSMRLGLYLGGLMQFYFPLRQLPTDFF
jgi:hypothetical protein